MPEGTPAAPAPPPILRPRTGIAWAVIGVLFLLLQAAQFLRGGVTAVERAAALNQTRLQVQQLYGMESLVAELEGLPRKGVRLKDIEEMSKGPVPGRQRYSVVAADLEGPATARAGLEETERLLGESGRSFEGGEAAVQAVLLRLYAGEDRPHDPEVLSAGEKATLRTELGWFGDLALAPEGSADRAAVLAPAKSFAGRLMVIAFCGLGVLGTGLLVALLHWVGVARGRIRFRFRPGAAPHGIYAETFAAWMVLFLVLQFALALLAPGRGILLSGTVSFGGSLAALGWPVLRGVPWGRVRADLGLFLSPTPLRDALSGVACWAMAVPVMAAGFLATVLLLGVSTHLAGPRGPFDSLPTPGHPISGELGSGSGILAAYLLACIAAPVVEETFFRGALYRHLRDAVGDRPKAVGVAFAAAASGLLFAAVHPQGWVAIPLLCAVAWGFVHAREWRGSLVAPMVAHGLHNAVVTTVAVWFMGG